MSFVMLMQKRYFAANILFFLLFSYLKNLNILSVSLFYLILISWWGSLWLTCMHIIYVHENTCFYCLRIRVQFYFIAISLAFTIEPKIYFFYFSFISSFFFCFLLNWQQSKVKTDCMFWHDATTNLWCCQEYLKSLEAAAFPQVQVLLRLSLCK